MSKYVTIESLQLSDDVKALNPQLAQKPKEPKTDARKQLEAEIRQNFAKQFEAIWQRLNGPPLEKEFYFCQDRQWRADYRCGNVLIELEGGIWTGGRHTNGKGYCDDAVKYNTASMMGYSLIRIPTGFATENYLQKIIDYIRMKEAK